MEYSPLYYLLKKRVEEMENAKEMKRHSANMDKLRKAFQEWDNRL